MYFSVQLSGKNIFIIPESKYVKSGNSTLEGPLKPKFVKA